MSDTLPPREKSLPAIVDLKRRERVLWGSYCDARVPFRGDTDWLDHAPPSVHDTTASRLIGSYKFACKEWLQMGLARGGNTNTS